MNLLANYRPAAGRYVIFHAAQGDGGLGDRIIGLVSAFVLALLTQRHFRIHWDTPLPLQAVWQPACPEVPWDKRDYVDVPHQEMHLIDRAARCREFFSHGDVLHELPDCLQVRANQHFFSWFFGNRYLRKETEAYGLTEPAAVFREALWTLFRPTAELVSMYNAPAQCIRGKHTVGLQVRTLWNFDDGGGRLQPEELEHLYACAERLLTGKENGQLFVSSDEALIIERTRERFPGITVFDLYLNVDDGLRYLWREDLHPSVWWAIDTHMDFEWCLTKSRGFDFVFAAQRDGAKQLRQAGIHSARWLPLACDPETHRRHEVPKKYDFCFVGNMFPGPRTDLVRLLQQYYRNSFVGQAYFDEMARIFSETKVVFNCAIKNDINMRTFEALACGSLLLTNDLSDNGQADLFRDGVHLATYRDADELLDKVRFYLDRQELRERIAAAGRQEVLAKHTYEHRLRQLLARVKGKLAADAIPKAIEGKGRSNQSSINPEPASNDTGQDAAYFEFARPELLARVPLSAKRVLDIGCGAGRLGESIKARQACELTGIDLNPGAIAAARNRLDRVFAGDIERLEPAFTDGEFDAIICGDVLEHLRNPAKVLRRLRKWLADDGVLIASIPNVRHRSVVTSLLEGNWTYEPAGLLDCTHRRFFTRRSIQRMFEDENFETEPLASIQLPEDDTRQAAAEDLRIGGLQLTDLPREEAQEFFTYQWLVVARKARPQLHAGGANGSAPRPEQLELPHCLVLMITYNRLAYTKLALEALLASDYPDLEVVVWDNASTDGTTDYLEDRLADVPHAKLIKSDRNLGVVIPMNKVWGPARHATLLAKIDNDTTVPPDLLKKLAVCHRRSRRFGVLSGFHFRKEGAALAHEGWVLSYDGVPILPQRFVGGCAVMIRRQLLDETGPIPSLAQQADRPFMDSGWTAYQERLGGKGLVHGYPWPPIHVDHMEDTRSEHCIRSPEHEDYKKSLRGMSLEEFTEELCVWPRRSPARFPVRTPRASPC